MVTIVTLKIVPLGSKSSNAFRADLAAIGDVEEVRLVEDDDEVLKAIVEELVERVESRLEFRQ